MIYMNTIAVVALLLIAGCATLRNTAQLGTPEVNNQIVTVQDLVKNWEAYSIYYAGISDDTPTAILFDPKNDDKALAGKRWEKVEDQKLLTSMIDFVERYTQFDPRLYGIVGPDQQVYGYVFSPTNEVYMKVADGKTIYVYDIESPLYKNDGRDEGLSISSP